MPLRLLDLFCGAGGAAMGYHRAGFEVVGVDHDPRHAKRYPFPLIVGDALDYVAAHGWEYDAIHASPPCQQYSITRHSHRKEHPDLLAPTREAVAGTGRPYVLENVEGAPLYGHRLMLCGSMFDLTAVDTDGTRLRLRRHRLFESDHLLLAPGPCRHDTRIPVGGAYGGGSTDRVHARFVRRGGYTPATTVRAALLGIDWAMTTVELSQAIPPAYTEHIGVQLRDICAAVPGPVTGQLSLW